MSTRRLVLFCSVYPDTTGETFLHNEIPFLKKKFDQILVITESQKTIHDPKLEVINVEKVFSKQLTWRLIVVFLLEVLRNGILSFGKNKVALASILYANNIRSVVKGLLDSGKVSEEDSFYTYWMNESTIGLSLLKSKKYRLNIFSRVHGWDLYNERHPYNYLPYRDQILRKVNKVLSISQSGVDYLEHRYGFREKLNVSRLGVEKALELSKNEEIESQIQIVSCSSVIPLKRVELIAKSIFSVKKVKVNWVHFGDGPGMESLKLYVKTNIPDNVNVDLKGFTSNQDILRFYSKNKVHWFINLSETEGIPVSIMEAFSYGIPSIATNVGGVSELVEDGVNGFLVEKVEPDQIGDIITDNLESHQEFSDNAIKTFQQKYWDEKNYTELGEELLR
jgi:glycosyltransferase involved in cell wall biosynthesis